MCCWYYLFALSEPSCDEPPKLPNGFVTRIEHTLEYHCLSGFTLEGHVRRICRNGSYWTGFDPTCVRDTAQAGKTVLLKTQCYRQLNCP